MEMVADFIFLGSKITVDSDRSHNIKRCLLFERKAMTNLDSVVKSRDSTLSTNDRIVKATVYRCKSRTIKKTKCQRIDSF